MGPTTHRVSEERDQDISIRYSQTRSFNISGGNRTITIGIPQFTNPGSTYGFAVEFTNPFSSIKYDIDTGNYSYDTVRLLDPLPAGSGEWLELPVAKWDANFVSCQSSEQNKHIVGCVNFAEDVCLG